MIIKIGDVVTFRKFVSLPNEENCNFNNCLANKKYVIKEIRNDYAGFHQAFYLFNDDNWYNPKCFSIRKQKLKLP
jgi:hypothetical protein